MKAKQLLEEAKLDKTYWGKKIIEAEARGHFTETMRLRAEHWQTCACGRQDKRLHRSDGVPRDSLMAEFGYYFSNQVDQDNFICVAETLCAIERRAAKLLAEME